LYITLYIKYRKYCSSIVWNIQFCIVSIKTTCSGTSNIMLFTQYYVYKCTIRSKSKGLVHVLDHQGHPIRKIKTKKEDRTLLYITLCSHGNIWYSDFFSLYCIKLDGKDTTTVLVPGIVVISLWLYLVFIWYWYWLLSL
jgi:hypothetical protein